MGKFLFSVIHLRDFQICDAPPSFQPTELNWVGLICSYESLSEVELAHLNIGENLTTLQVEMEILTPGSVFHHQGIPKDTTTEMTLRMCLGEIDRCYNDNVMPFFLNLTR